jgi:hypothetical protein
VVYQKSLPCVMCSGIALFTDLYSIQEQSLNLKYQSCILFYIYSGYHREEEEGPRGWIVGGQLLEDSFYIRTGQENTSCPNGIGERGTWAL